HLLPHSTARTALHTLSLHDALPISPADAPRGATGILIAIGAAGVLLSFATFAVLCLRADERREAELLLRADAHALLLERFVEKQDRKSTRLNSSHVKISYAVFCLKK